MLALVVSVPFVNIRFPLTTRPLPSVAVPVEVLLRVKSAILFVVPAVVPSKNNVPNAPVPVIFRLEFAEPVMLLVEFIEATVPARFSVLEPMLNLPLVNVSEPLIVGEPLKLKPPALLNSKLPSVAPEIVLALPFINISPKPELVWIAVPAMLPPTVKAKPASANVPAVSVKFPVIPLLL